TDVSRRHRTRGGTPHRSAAPLLSAPPRPVTERRFPCSRKTSERGRFPWKRFAGKMLERKERGASPAPLSSSPSEMVSHCQRERPSLVADELFPLAFRQSAPDSVGLVDRQGVLAAQLQHRAGPAYRLCPGLPASPGGAPLAVGMEERGTVHP